MSADPPRRPSVFVAIGFDDALAVLGAGCGTRTTETFLIEPVVLEGTATEIDVVNFAGDVEIERAAPGEAARIVAHRRVGRGEAVAPLAEMFPITVDHAPRVDDRSGAIDRVQVVARARGEMPPGASVDLEIRIPRIDGVAVTTARGDIVLRDVAGPIVGSVTDGDIDLRTRLPLVDPVELISSDGDIDALFPPGSAGTVRAESTNGRSRIDVTGEIIAFLQSGEELAEITLPRDPDNRILLRTTNGDIRVRIRPLSR